MTPYKAPTHSPRIYNDWEEAEVRDAINIHTQGQLATSIVAETKASIIKMVDGENVEVDEHGRTIHQYKHPQTGAPSHPRVLGNGQFLWA